MIADGSSQSPPKGITVEGGEPSVTPGGDDYRTFVPPVRAPLKLTRRRPERRAKHYVLLAAMVDGMALFALSKDTVVGLLFLCMAAFLSCLALSMFFRRDLVIVTQQTISVSQGIVGSPITTALETSSLLRVYVEETTRDEITIGGEERRFLYHVEATTKGRGDWRIPLLEDIETASHAHFIKSVVDTYLDIPS